MGIFGNEVADRLVKIGVIHSKQEEIATNKEDRFDNHDNWAYISFKAISFATPAAVLII